MADQELFSKTITVRFLDPPKAGTKGISWKVKDEFGDVYGVMPKDAKTIAVGDRIDIDYTEKQGDRGVFRDIKAIYDASVPAAGPSGGATSPVAHDATRDRNIFLTGTLQQALAAGLTIADIVPCAAQLAKAWDVFHGDYMTHVAPPTRTAPAATATAKDDPFTPRQPMNGHANGHAVNGRTPRGAHA